MKKLLFSAMSIGMMALFSSCGNGETTSGDNGDSTNKEVKKEISQMTWEEKQAQLNIDCGDPNDCDEVECEIMSAKIHEFNEFSEFSACIAAYYGRKPIPPAKKMPVSEISPLVAPACDQYRIQFDLGTDSSTHADIAFRIVKGYVRPAGETNSYSVSMFKGILVRSPDTFHLYRGLGGRFGDVTTLMVMATSGQDTVYFGDLSDAFPMPIDTLIKK